MSFSLVGTAWDLPGFERYLEGVDLSWANSVTLHHTGAPDLAGRGSGLVVQHIRNIQDFYENGKGWTRGPHLFVDDVDINGMSPLSAPGIHAVSFNSKSIGIEVLGNYDVEDPESGRGLECWQMAAKVTAAILRKMRLTAHESAVRFHRDDPKTSKSCPGEKVSKDWFLAMVAPEVSVIPKRAEPVVNQRLAAIEWQVQSIMRENDDLPEDRLEELFERLESVVWQAKKLTEGR
jgi:hypothetical protein